MWNAIQGLAELASMCWDKNLNKKNINTNGATTPTDRQYNPTQVANITVDILYNYFFFLISNASKLFKIDFFGADSKSPCFFLLHIRISKYNNYYYY